LPSSESGADNPFHQLGRGVEALFIVRRDAEIGADTRLKIMAGVMPSPPVDPI
jgi:hypothetical protein